MGGMLPERPRIQCGYRGTYQHRVVNATGTQTEVSGKLLILRERQQAVRVTESKCLLADAERCSRCPKGGQGTASRSRKLAELGESLRRDT